MSSHGVFCLGYYDIAHRGHDGPKEGGCRPFVRLSRFDPRASWSVEMCIEHLHRKNLVESWEEAQG